MCPKGKTERNFAWILPCVTTATSWFATCIGGRGKHGDLALLPPVFSADPTLPILLLVGYIGELWLNDIYNTPVAAGGTGMGKARPAISRLSCCHQEVIAGKTTGRLDGR